MAEQATVEPDSQTEEVMNGSDVALNNVRQRSEKRSLAEEPQKQ
jgi:hypothetical protein